MTYYNEQLQLLKEQVARKARLETMLKDLRNQRNELDRKVIKLEVEKESEMADVERLECRSLAAFFYSVIGKKDEKLDKERQEAYAAAVRYDAAARELATVEEDLKRYESELRSLLGCEERYTQLLKEKSESIKTSGTREAEEILRLEERIAYLNSQKKEIDEAIHAGKKAKSTTDQILSSLSSAQDWGTFDMLGGGMISGLAKYSSLDKAQELIEQLQVQLRRFKTELADVTIHADLQVKVDEFLRFADYFFDNIFTDWAVQARIKESQGQVRKTKTQIESVLNKLLSMRAASEDEQKRIKERLNELIVKAEL